jgi:LAO/AO transport system kinase
MIHEHLKQSFYSHPTVNKSIPEIEGFVMNGNLSATMAAKHLLGIFEKGEGESYE